jgi:hypothetical protein
MCRAVQVACAAVTGALAALLLGGRSLAQESTPQFNMTKVTDNEIRRGRAASLS